MRDRTKVSVRHRVVGYIEARVVEDVKKLSTELESESFSKQEILVCDEVEILKRRPCQVIPTFVAESIRRRYRKRSRIKPFVNALRESGVMVADVLRSLAASADVGGVSAGEDVVGLP